MRIAFVSLSLCLSKGNGVVSQALTWKKGLEELGHEVHLCNPWDYDGLKDYDVIQVFGFSENTADLILSLSRINPNIAIAPIFDPDYSIFKAKLRARYGSFRFRLFNRYSALRDIRGLIKRVLVRSEFEKRYMIEAFGFAEEQCKIVMLPSGIKPQIPDTPKEPFCFHLSLLTDERKNVKRLIDASVKYNFKLVLAGGVQNEERARLLKSWLEGKDNITYLGYISEETKIEMYKRAKVFALPSTNEGVGIVALEAAAYGCDVVITSLGGPKEYYGEYATVVNPYNVDEIGLAVREFLEGKTCQPRLAQHLYENYSLEQISKRLEIVYSHI